MRQKLRAVLHLSLIHIWIIVAAAHPRFAPFVAPKTFAQIPARTAIVRAKHARGHAARPERTGLRGADRRERPHEFHCTRRGVVRPRALHWFFWAGGGRNFGPRCATICALPHCDAIVPEAKRGVPRTVTRIGEHLRDRFAVEVVRRDVPCARRRAIGGEKPLARGD